MNFINSIKFIFRHITTIMISLANKLYFTRNITNLELIHIPLEFDVKEFCNINETCLILDTQNNLWIRNSKLKLLSQNIINIKYQIINSWTINENGEIYIIPENTLMLKKFFFPKNVIAISCGYLHTVIIDDDHQAWCIGDNQHGQLGLGDLQHRNNFTNIDVVNVIAVSCNFDNTIILDSDRCAKICGDNNYTQCGVAENICQPNLLNIDIPEVVKIFCDVCRSYLIDAQGILYFSGYISNNIGNTTKFIQIELPYQIIDICFNLFYTFLLDSRGMIYVIRQSDGNLNFVELMSTNIDFSNHLKNIKSANSNIF